jgi:hypothetical protein
MKKKIVRFTAAALLCGAGMQMHAQVFTRPADLIQTLPGTSLDRLRVQNGLFSHFVSGNIGGFTATDKWIGIGAPLSSLYGYRTQWGTQAFIKALRERTPGGIKDALLEWGNGGGEFRLRYITNPSSSTGFRNILTFDENGNGVVGLNRSSGNVAKFEVNAGNLPVVGLQTSYASIINAVNTTPSGTFGNSVVGLEARVGSSSALQSSITGLSGKAASNRVGTVSYSNTGVFGEASGAGATNKAISGTSTGFGVAVANYGVHGSAFNNLNTNNTTPANYGVFGNATALGTANPGSNLFGVYGQADANILLPGSSNNAYAVYGRIQGTGTGINAAGYFDGPVFAASYNLISDGNLKTDVVNEKNTLEKFMQLRPVQYTFDQKAHPEMSLPGNLQHGFIAQELAKVYPEMVTKAFHPVFDSAGSVIKSNEISTVNYTMLIPVLTSALQQQTREMEALKKEMAQLKAASASPLAQKAAAAEKSAVEMGYMLSQNLPNPFNTSTIIKYNIPQANVNASLMITDLNGKMAQRFSSLRNSGQVTVNAGTLQTGMYIYTLVVNGEEMISKKMIVE